MGTNPSPEYEMNLNHLQTSETPQYGASTASTINEDRIQVEEAQQIFENLSKQLSKTSSA